MVQGQQHNMHKCLVMQQVSLETDLHETVSMLLADSLRLLLEHGLLNGGKPVSYTIGCFPAWRNWGKGQIFNSTDECAAWKVVKHYYGVKVRERMGRRGVGEGGGGSEG